MEELERRGRLWLPKLRPKKGQLEEALKPNRAARRRLRLSPREILRLQTQTPLDPKGLKLQLHPPNSPHGRTTPYFARELARRRAAAAAARLARQASQRAKAAAKRRRQKRRRRTP